ncbi:MAG: ABC transporter ATP-binding protein [Planctomycetota bacterium]|jgi:multiple sugar transport system ATP-binding protein
MSRVVLSNVSKVYDHAVHAVSGLDLQVADGELMVLVGPSGSGKSTVLRLIAGLEELTAGEVRIGDRVVNDLHPKDRDVAMVFQDYALYPHMSVARNMGFSLELRRASKDEIGRRVQGVAVLLGLEDLLGRRPHALSGGQQQRVALGRALVREPTVFLFDEPLSNLDARLRVTTRAEIRVLQRQAGATMIYVTHDQEEAMTLGDRVAVMCDGRLQQVGAPLELYGRPANRFVASFVGSPPMNFLEGRLESREGGLTFVEGLDGAPEGRAHLPVPPAWRERLEPVGGRDLMLGLRPQAFSEADRLAAEPGAALHVEIGHVEALGEFIDVVGKTDRGNGLVARLPARDDFPGSGRIMLCVDMQKAHLFEPGEYGRSLLS